MARVERITPIVKLNSSLCGYSDAYTLIQRTLTVPNNRNKKIILKNCA